MPQGERVTRGGTSREALPPLRALNNAHAAELAGDDPPPALDRLRAELDREPAGGGSDGARFAIEVDGLVVGWCDPAAVGKTHGAAMLGIPSGDPDDRGKGSGQEAVRLLLVHAFRLRNVRRVRLRVHAGNGRTIAADRARRFVEEGRPREQARSNGRHVAAVRMDTRRGEGRTP